MLKMDTVHNTENGDIHAIGRKWLAFHNEGKTAEIVTQDDGIFVYLFMGEDQSVFEWVAFDDNPEILMLWEGDNNWNVEEVLCFCESIFQAHTEPSARITANLCQVHTHIPYRHIIKDLRLKKSLATYTIWRVWNREGFEWGGMPF